MSRCLLILALLSLMFAPGSEAAAATKRPTIKLIQSFEDVTGRLTARDIVTPTVDHLFTPVKAFVYPTSTSGATWVALDISKRAGDELVLKVMHTTLNSLEASELSDTGLTTQTLASDKQGVHRFYYVPLNSKATKLRVYLRLTADNVLTNIPILLMPKAEVSGDIDADTVATGIFYGIILTMIFYNFFLFLFLKDSIFLLYSGYLVCFCLMRLSMDGLLVTMIKSNFGHWRSFAQTSIADLAALMMVFYTKEFLGIKRRSPRLSQTTTGVCALIGLAALACPFMKHEAAIKTAYLLHALLIPYILLLTISSIRFGFKPARYFLIGISAMVTATLYVVLFNSGVFPPGFSRTWNMDFALRFSSAFEMIFFSFALADRITHFKNGRKEAQLAFEQSDLKRKEAETQMAEEATKAAQYFAIAQMTQALAHDVRKPFSMLKMGLERLSVTADSNPQEVREMALKIKDHVGRAFADVNAMIADVMEVSSGKSNIHPEETSLRLLILSALHQTFRLQEQANLEIRYQLLHKQMVGVDTHKTLRVFSNILENARQAMKNQGSLWIRTKDLSADLIEVTLGNSDTVIPPDDLPRIFDSFFTKKKGGTGLGLAICRKIIESHGGAIRCTSSAESGTEFSFTLPATVKPEESVAALPQSTREIQQDFANSLLTPDEIPTQVLAEPTKQRVAVIDDDIFVREMWEKTLANQCELQTFDSPSAFLAHASQDSSYFQRLNLVITDHFFIDHEPTGRDLAKTVKASRPDLPVFLCSDADLDPALLRGAVDRKIAKMPVAFAILESYMDPAPERRILVIDDEKLYCDLMVDQIKGLTTVLSPLICRVAMTAAEAMLCCREEQFDLILCDIDLGKGEETGLDALPELRRLSKWALIFVHSNRDTEKDRATAIIRGADGYIPKPVSACDILDLLEIKELDKTA